MADRYAKSTEAIIAHIEKGIRGMFADGVVLAITANEDGDGYVVKTVANDYLEKAEATSDPTLAEGYRKLAKKMDKKARKAMAK
jgi:hypothetical protein